MEIQIRIETESKLCYKDVCQILIEYITDFKVYNKKSRIRETKNLSTDADSRTDTILERLRDLSLTINKNKNTIKLEK